MVRRNILQAETSLYCAAGVQAADVVDLVGANRRAEMANDGPS